MANNKVEEINIDNFSYYFLDELINIKDPDFQKITVDQKSFEDLISVILDIKFHMVAKPLYIIFYKIKWLC